MGIHNLLTKLNYIIKWYIVYYYNIYIYIYICVCVCVRVCVYGVGVCVYVCVIVHPSLLPYAWHIPNPKDRGK